MNADWRGLAWSLELSLPRRAVGSLELLSKFVILSRRRRIPRMLRLPMPSLGIL